MTYRVISETSSEPWETLGNGTKSWIKPQTEESSCENSWQELMRDKSSSTFKHKSLSVDSSVNNRSRNDKEMLMEGKETEWIKLTHDTKTFSVFHDRQNIAIIIVSFSFFHIHWCLLSLFHPLSHPLYLLVLLHSSSAWRWMPVWTDKRPDEHQRRKLFSLFESQPSLCTSEYLYPR